ncbi:MAG TPA: phospholipase A [Steroidobacteraceae bacterium]|jgi:outer membrane phospholipase A|nr:phospholipase A [Steroidobacteraceae bacterium]
MTSIRLLAVATLLAAGHAAHAEYILSVPEGVARAGAPLRADLTILNDSDAPLRVELPAPLRARLETSKAAMNFELAPDRSGTVEIAARQFLKVALRGDVPEAAAETATLTLTGFETNRVAVPIAPRDTSSNAAWNAPTPAARQTGTALIDKPPPLAVSVYEPVYFVVGGDGGLNARFQISLRFRLFDDHGRLARRLPWIDDLYLSFSQTALWDLGELSKPFKDSSYRPRLFYANYDLARYFDGNLRFGVESGIGHESNGKEGDDSRSYNMLYARPTLTLGDPDGFRAYFAPLVHNYIAASDNPDIADYRGYVDWLFGVGSKGGLDFWGVLRKGTRSDYGSVELNASYPLSKLSGGDLTGWLMLQYFNGYGESLLDYNRKLDSQLRLGIAIAL